MTMAASLIAIANTQFCTITVRAVRHIDTADGSRKRLLDRITTSAAATTMFNQVTVTTINLCYIPAIADPPAPMATPTREAASAYIHAS